MVTGSERKSRNQKVGRPVWKEDAKMTFRIFTQILKAALWIASISLPSLSVRLLLLCSLALF